MTPQQSPYSLDFAAERELGLFVRNQLNAGTAQLDVPVTERLFAARQAALAGLPTQAGELSLASVGRSGWSWLEERLRPLAMAFGLVLVLLAGNQTLSLQHIESQEDIDSALLSDELPIDAYLDRGFQSWLADSSRQ
ncbi:DUF3619 family protein [Uliginosibacterium aquaticum]|uniref:DUF3619 family protein n=1 Tax=Uliginosibacterium aquaticum TaxID=2731212 RepID=A0ABX2IKR1_9RHOO|nr:DUF3619 family protein [Uliginosibacterium aquaticum]NSL56473.1 DUF3619 family protein [Uliginosibacterium aquaticum]